MIEIPDFNKAFQDGAVMPCEWRGPIGRIQQLELGDLKITSGYVIARDPTYSGQYEPFTTKIPSGSYPVSLSIAHLDGDTEICAAAMLSLNKATPVKWVLATREGENISELAKDFIFGCGVDAGSLTFMDIETAKRFDQKHKQEEGFDQFVFNEMYKTPPQYEWANIIVDNSTGLNVIIFRSGFGDGFYPCFWGYDDKGQIACLVTDFRVLDGTMTI